MSSYQPTMPRPIPAGGGRSPSPTTSAHSGSSSQGGGSDFSHSWHWRHTPARSSSGHSSDLMFSMEPELRSASGSPRPGSADQAFLYDVPSPLYAQPPPGTVPVCPRCRRQFYAADHNSQQAHDHNAMYRPRALVCPTCEDRESSSQRASRRHEDDFFASNSGRYDRTPRQNANTYQPQHQPPPSASRRHQHSTSAQLTNRMHVVGRAFPSYNGHPPPYPSPPPYTRSISQPHQSASRWTAASLPPATFVTGSYRPQYQLPQLITQLEHRAAPAPTISPRTTDPIVMTPVSPSSRRGRGRQS